MLPSRQENVGCIVDRDQTVLLVTVEDLSQLGQHHSTPFIAGSRRVGRREQSTAQPIEVEHLRIGKRGALEIRTQEIGDVRVVQVVVADLLVVGAKALEQSLVIPGERRARLLLGHHAGDGDVDRDRDGRRDPPGSGRDAL